MPGKIVVRSRTIQEAVHEAAKMLGIEVDQLEYEVIDQGRQSWFWRRPAILLAGKRLTVDPISLSEEVAEVVVSTVDESGDETGVAWVQGHQVFCKNGRRQYASITPSKEVKLFVNGQLTSTKTVVTEQDTIEVLTEEAHKEALVKVSVSQDQMLAELYLEPAVTKKKILIDQEPSQDLVLYWETELVPDPPDQTERLILQKLKELGIVFGVDFECVKKAAQSTDAIWCTVATGRLPVKGEHGYVQLSHRNLRENKDVFEFQDEMNWKERYSLPNVKTGEIIGRVISATQGQAGMDVLGRVIPSPPVQEVQLIAVKGVGLHGRNSDLVAESSGRIKIVRRPNNVWMFEILPQYIHNGNVDIKSGNIRFAGDVYILGDVLDGMTVDAGGSLHITGSVSGAWIRSGGDIIINGSITKSTIICGHSKLLWDRLLPILSEIRDEIIVLVNLIEQVQRQEASSKNVNFQALLKVLVEVKCKGLPAKVRKLQILIALEKLDPQEEVVGVLGVLEKCFLFFHPLILEKSQLEKLVAQINRMMNDYEYESNKKMNIRVQSISNSSIQSAWNLFVERFSYASVVYCKNGVDIQGTLRGGKIVAEQFVIAKEIGSNSGTHTEIGVNDGEGYIQSTIIWMDTLIRIGNVKKKLLNMEMDVRARLRSTSEVVMR